MKQKYFSSILILILLALPSFAQPQAEVYSRVKIFLDGKSPASLFATGLDFEHSQHYKNHYFIGDYSTSELQKVRASGFRYEVLVPDLYQNYRQRQTLAFQKIAQSDFPLSCKKVSDYKTPSRFALGSMGGHFTYEEMLAHLDTMKARWPNLISAKNPIGTFKTHENRDILWLRISNNANTDEAEPEVLYSAIHHAREPVSMAQLIFYMYYLLENYASDPSIKGLVDNTEMYFVPCLNPDGYIKNQNEFPEGGGMWRKNLRDNLDGNLGVDLNRNYGYNWGLNDFGSSPNSFADSYRGPSAFSEPETQAMKWFCENRQFKLAYNYHTYNNILIHPWGYTDAFTPDSNSFSAFNKAFTRENQYQPGTSNQTLAYLVNGGSDDWMYSTQTAKPKMFVWTPEVGDWFWPEASEIIDLCKENVYQNLGLARAALEYATLENLTPKWIPNMAFHFKYRLRRSDLKTQNTSITVSIQSISGVNFASPKTYNAVLPFANVLDSIPLTVKAGTAPGQRIGWIARLTFANYQTVDTIWAIYGAPTKAFEDNFNNASNWVGDWGTTSESFVSGPFSFTDSPNAPYLNDTIIQTTLKRGIDLRKSKNAWLTFKTRYQIEKLFDFAKIEASNDSGAVWFPLCGTLTRKASSFSRQAVGLPPIFDGEQINWVTEIMDLKNFTGKKVWLRLSMGSDAGGFDEDGIYMDDMVVWSFDSILTKSSETISTAVSALICYPNPGKGKINILLDGSNNPEAGWIEISDLTGRKVFTKWIENEKTIQPEMLFLPGIYTARFVSQNHSLHTRFVVHP